MKKQKHHPGLKGRLKRKSATRLSTTYKIEVDGVHLGELTLLHRKYLRMLEDVDLHPSRWVEPLPQYLPSRFVLDVFEKDKEGK